MNIGLCGSHRTRKTTMAEAISRKTVMPFVKTGTSEVFRKYGMDPSEPMDFRKRLWIQHKIPDTAEKQKNENRAFQWVTLWHAMLTGRCIAKD
jgi:cytidylate kinase